MFSSKLLQGSLLVQKSTIPPLLFCNSQVGTSTGIELFVVCVCVCACACLQTLLHGDCVLIKLDYLLQFPNVM